MPIKPRPSDWERYFGPKARRRRGPLGLLGWTFIAGGLLAGIIVMANFGMEARANQLVIQHATETPAWATAYARGTGTALAMSGTSTVLSTVTGVPATDSAVPSATPMPVATVGAPAAIALKGSTSVVTERARLRSAPRVFDNILGVLLPNDQVQILEGAPPVNPEWYRVRIVKTTAVENLRVGMEGWVAATVLPPSAPSAVNRPPAALATPTVKR